MTRRPQAALPFSIIGSTSEVQTADGRTVKGRQYLWGVAEVENEEHCDFKKLRSLLIRTHMLDLIQTTEEGHYEQYRQAQMETRKFGSVGHALLRSTGGVLSLQQGGVADLDLVPQRAQGQEGREPQVQGGGRGGESRRSPSSLP